MKRDILKDTIFCTVTTIMAPEPNNMHNKTVEKDIETNSGVTIINEEEFDENNSSGGEENDEYDGYKLLQQDEEGNIHVATANSDSDTEDENEEQEFSSYEHFAEHNLECVSTTCDASLDIDYKVITHELKHLVHRSNICDAPKGNYYT